MADFCEQCAERLSLPSGDLKGLTSKEDDEQGLACVVICEGCGVIQVDSAGNCISDDCLEKGHLNKKENDDGKQDN